MNTFLKIFNVEIHEQSLFSLSINVKVLEKVLVSFSFVIFFLASCTTNTPSSSPSAISSLPDTFVDTTAPTLNCPETINVSLPVDESSLTLTDAVTDLVATDETDVASPTITYDPLEVTISDTSVTATATDAAGNESDCTFDIVVSVASQTLTNIELDCSAATPLIAQMLGEFPVVLDETIRGITATDNGNPIESPDFTYDPAEISEAGTHRVSVTLRDSENNVATSNDELAQCIVMFTVITLSNCPSAISDAIVDQTQIWIAPTVAGVPDDEGRVVVSVEAIEDAGTADAATVDSTMGIFRELGRYSVTFTVMDAEGPIMIDGGAVDCQFAVTVVIDPASINYPDNSLFALAIENSPHSSSNPFLIQTAFDLRNLAAVVNGETIEVNGTNFSNDFPSIHGGEPGNYDQADYRLGNSLALSGSSNFTPIGTESNPFKGTFDGDEKNISSLNFNDNTVNNVGLFGVLSSTDASIYDLTLSNANITGASNVGGLVGQMMDRASLSNVFTVGGSINGSNVIGGLVGRMGSNTRIDTASTSVTTGRFLIVNIAGGLVGTMSNSSLTNVSASMSVSGSDTLGGLVGSMEADSTISNAFALGNIRGLNFLGGLVGTVSDSSSMTNTFASGRTTGSNTLGGLVGSMSGSSRIFNAYASGIVSNSNTGSPMGGLVGSLEGSSSLTNTVAWAKIEPTTSTATIGGLVGSAPGNENITDSFWDETVNSAFRSSTYGNGQSTDRLQSNTGNLYIHYNNEDTVDVRPGVGVVWDFGETDEYPVFKITGFPSLECQRDPSAIDIDCPNPQQ